MPAFLRLFKHRVARHDVRIKTLITAGAPGSDPALLAADEWLAGALVDCLDDASAHVANLIDSVADAACQVSASRAPRARRSVRARGC